MNAYRCRLCGFDYIDHGPTHPMGYHRRMMARFRATTWEQAERLIAQGTPTTSDDPTWEGQECGDLSACAQGATPCPGRLVFAEN